MMIAQTHKDDAVEMLHSICQQIWKNQQRPQDWKRSITIPVQRRAMSIVFISHDSKLMLKILQARLQQYMSQESPDVQAGFRKGKETRDETANICWIMEKAR